MSRKCLRKSSRKFLPSWGLVEWGRNFRNGAEVTLRNSPLQKNSKFEVRTQNTRLEIGSFHFVPTRVYLISENLRKLGYKVSKKYSPEIGQRFWKHQQILQVKTLAPLFSTHPQKPNYINGSNNCKKIELKKNIWSTLLAN